MMRELKYIEQYKAAHVFPFSGPPCFLDDDLFHLNDLDRDEANFFRTSLPSWTFSTATIRTTRISFSPELRSN